MRPRTPRGPESVVARDTIVALATAVGESAVGVLRVSGAAAVETAQPLVRAAVPLAEFPSHVLRRVAIIDPRTGARLDDALCAVMRTPRSYTGEDVVEISCHGSPSLLRMVTDLLRAGGARLAEPGEFTRRAFLNGRLDLAQAEAVALLIGARTQRAVELAARALRGELSARVQRLRDLVLELVAGLEVRLDFPEEGVGTDIDEAAVLSHALAVDVSRWAEDARRGRVVHEGLTVALVGAPNAGKSTLLNALLGRDRAIVSPTPGTTRDVVEGTVVLAGVPVTFLDTAGIGLPGDAIEAEGVRRSLKAMDESDLLVIVHDGSLSPDRRVVMETAERCGVVVRAKADLPAHPDASSFRGAIAVSAHTGEGMDRLVSRLIDEVTERVGLDGDEGGIVASIRQVELLRALGLALSTAGDSLMVAPLEAALVDLREALRIAAEMLGNDVGDSVLDRIFSTFCLGK